MEARVSQQNPGQVIQVPNTLRLKVGGRLGGFDPAAIAKAEAALKNLSGNFAQWLQDEVVKLETARQRVKSEGVNAETMEQLYLRAHDLKGLGTTYEFPLITRIAASLCKLIDDKEKREKAPMVLIDGHIDAIKAAVRDSIKTDDHPVGKVLVSQCFEIGIDLVACSRCLILTTEVNDSVARTYEPFGETRLSGEKGLELISPLLAQYLKKFHILHAVKDFAHSQRLLV